LERTHKLDAREVEMNYGSLVRESWEFTWRYRFLWVLGLFAGGAAGASFGGSGWRQPAEWPVGQTPGALPIPGVDMAAPDLVAWATANVALIVAAAILFAVVGLALMVVSLIAQGGMARATIEIAEHHPMSLGQAWQAGVRLFWRFLALWLLVAMIAIVVGAVVASLVGLAGFIGYTVQVPNAVAAVAAVLLGLPLLVIGIAFAIGMTIVIPFAQRAMAEQNIGPVDGLRAGVALLRAHVGESLMVWLLNIALGIGAGIAATIAMVVVLFVLGVVGFIFWAALGFTTPTVIYAVLGGVAFAAAGLVLLAIANTFFWNYWTIAYLRLTGHDGEVVAA
jgi:hypothetical protein